MSIRCFIAVELEESVKVELGRMQKRLAKQLRGNEFGINWVKPERIHLTLKFLGDVDETLVPEICSAVSEAAEHFGPIEIELSGLGCFGPNNRPARVLWAGIVTGAEVLGELAGAIDMNLGLLDFGQERRKFSPHLTLARIKQPNAGKAVRNLLEKEAVEVIAGQTVSEITVFQSELTQSGPIYTSLAHVPLT
ncbi:MAG: RNA 2',3'-cyclic phosphodiesterase [Sedimentisphaerales bacterium]|nr:RNA 2',3'-cyclic phosphodiesterase [Sedimentisphaerales bacterium]